MPISSLPGQNTTSIFWVRVSVILQIVPKYYANDTQFPSKWYSITIEILLNYHLICGQLLDIDNLIPTVDVFLSYLVSSSPFARLYDL